MLCQPEFYFLIFNFWIYFVDILTNWYDRYVFGYTTSTIRYNLYNRKNERGTVELIYKHLTTMHSELFSYILIF